MSGHLFPKIAERTYGIPKIHYLPIEQPDLPPPGGFVRANLNLPAPSRRGKLAWAGALGDDEIWASLASADSNGEA